MNAVPGAYTVKHFKVIMEEHIIEGSSEKVKNNNKMGEGKITYLLSATFRRHFISNKRKQEMLKSFLHKVMSFPPYKYRC